MAKGQQGISATTVWMIVFCFFWLVSTVWLVVLYTGQEELRTANARLQREYRQVVSPEEFRSIELIKAASESGPTAIGLLEEARAQTAELASGDPKDGVGALRTKRNDLLQGIRRDKLVDDPAAFDEISLLSGFSLAYEHFKKEKARRAVTEERLAQLDAEVAKLAEINSQQKDDFEKRVQELQDRMNGIEADRADYRAEKDNAMATLVKDFEQRRAQTDADLTAERQKTRRSERLMRDMKDRLASQREKDDETQIGPGKVVTARVPDGRVLTAVTGDEIVYIDRGAGDRLVLGMKFAVYSAAAGIPEDGRSKAQIEVVSIADDSAECRVLRVQPGEVIVEGDWIANPVYNSQRPVTFVVLGEFDLDRDGQTDSTGHATVEAIIQEWGGTIAEEVDALTDFVVVGKAPPRPKAPANPTPEQAARAEALQRARDGYLSTLTTAQMLSVPTMTQDVFMNFLGQTATKTRP